MRAQDGGPTRSLKVLSRTFAQRQAVDPWAADDDDDAAADAQLLASGHVAGDPPSREERAARRREARMVALRDQHTAVREEAAALVKTQRAKPAPLSPSAFAQLLRLKAFADGTDCRPISGLYRNHSSSASPTLTHGGASLRVLVIWCGMVVHTL